MKTEEIVEESWALLKEVKEFMTKVDSVPHKAIMPYTVAAYFLALSNLMSDLAQNMQRIEEQLAKAQK